MIDRSGQWWTGTDFEDLATCGVLGAYADWKIDYSPTDHLLTAV